MANGILAALIFVPALFVYFLKSNAAIAFLSICGSFVLITFGNADLKDLTGQLNLHLNASTLNLILIIVPFLLTLLLTRKAFTGQVKTVINLIASILAGGLLALVAVPLLNASVSADFSNSWGWINIQKIQTEIIAAGLLLSFFLIWFSHSGKKHKHK